MLLGIWNNISNLRHFENEKFSEKYMIVILFIWYILQFTIYRTQLFWSLSCKKIKIHFIPELLHVWKRVIIDTTSKDTKEKNNDFFRLD